MRLFLSLDQISAKECNGIEVAENLSRFVHSKELFYHIHVSIDKKSPIMVAQICVKR